MSNRLVREKLMSGSNNRTHTGNCCQFSQHILPMLTRSKQNERLPAYGRVLDVRISSRPYRKGCKMFVCLHATIRKVVRCSYIMRPSYGRLLDVRIAYHLHR
jgi:hypothetical protein